MKKTLSGLARLAAFALALALLILLADTYFHQLDLVSSMAMEEMKARDDIELCFVGSSTARNHINTPLITELTGKKAFNAAVINASLPAHIAIIEELLRTNRPEWIVLTVDAYNFETAKEDTMTESVLMPHLSSWRTRLEYYMNLCREDGAYLDRALIFRPHGVLAPSEVIKNIGLIHDTAAAFERYRARLGDDIVYMGDGYLRYSPGTTPDELIRRYSIGKVTDYPFELFNTSKRMLSQIMAMCEDAGARLMVLITPNHTAQMLSEELVLPFTDAIVRFCRENDVPVLNFAYARPELMPRLDAYYYDLYHFNGDGSDIFSRAVAQAFELAAAGEDVRALFYADAEEYLWSIGFIANVWFTHDPKTNAFTADCNRGLSVTPEYAYALIGADGSERVLRDYDTNPVFVCGVQDGDTLRVYARPQGDAQAEPVWYDYPQDYDAFFGD